MLVLAQLSSTSPRSGRRVRRTSRTDNPFVAPVPCVERSPLSSAARQQSVRLGYTQIGTRCTRSSQACRTGTGEWVGWLSSHDPSERMRDWPPPSPRKWTIEARVNPSYQGQRIGVDTLRLAVNCACLDRANRSARENTRQLALPEEVHVLR